MDANDAINSYSRTEEKQDNDLGKPAAPQNHMTQSDAEKVARAAFERKIRDDPSESLPSLPDSLTPDLERVLVLRLQHGLLEPGWIDNLFWILGYYGSPWLKRLVEDPFLKLDIPHIFPEDSSWLPEDFQERLS